MTITGNENRNALCIAVIKIQETDPIEAADHFADITLTATMPRTDIIFKSSV